MKRILLAFTKGILLAISSLAMVSGIIPVKEAHAIQGATSSGGGSSTSSTSSSTSSGGGSTSGGDVGFGGGEELGGGGSGVSSGEVISIGHGSSGSGIGGSTSSTSSTGGGAFVDVTPALNSGSSLASNRVYSVNSEFFGINKRVRSGHKKNSKSDNEKSEDAGWTENSDDENIMVEQYGTNLFVESSVNSRNGESPEVPLNLKDIASEIKISSGGDIVIMSHEVETE